MPNEDIVQVKDRNGKVVPIFKKNLAEAIKRGGTPVGVEDKKPPEEEGGLKQFGRGAALGGFSGLGIPETQTPVEDLLKNLKGEITSTPGRLFEEMKKYGISGVPGAEAVRAGTGIGGGLAKSGKEIATSVGGNKPESIETLGHGLGSLLTQLLMLKGGKEAGEAPLAESEVVRGGKAVGKAAVEAPPKIVQSATGAKFAVNKAEKAAQAAAKEKLDAFEKAKAERASEVETQRAAKEARDTKAAVQHKSATQQELARARGEHKSEMSDVKGEAKKQAAEYKKNLDNKTRIEAQNAKNEATRQVLNKQVETGTRELTQNIKSTLDNAKKNFDKEYGEFDRKVLGKTPENPKGTLQANLNPAVKAVMDAKRNIIEGTEENIKPFQSILGRSERVETASGEMIPLEGQTIPVADLRGYIRELEEKMYDSNLAPDVKKALRSVVDAGKAEVSDAIKDVHGQSALDAYKDLNSRYSDYLTDWRDTSSTNPLPKVRGKLLEGVAQNNPNYPVHLDIGRTLKGANAQKAMVLLEKYRNFGADPKILADYNKALQQLDELPKSEKVPDVKKPKMPESATSVPLRLKKPPETEPFTPRGKEPEAPKTEPFDRPTMMRNTIEERLNMAGRIGQGYKLLKMVSDAIHMNPSGTLSEAEQMAVIEAVRRMMTSDRALNYFSKEAR